MEMALVFSSNSKAQIARAQLVVVTFRIERDERSKLKTGTRSMAFATRLKRCALLAKLPSHRHLITCMNLLKVLTKIYRVCILLRALRGAGAIDAFAVRSLHTSMLFPEESESVCHLISFRSHSCKIHQRNWHWRVATLQLHTVHVRPENKQAIKAGIKVMFRAETARNVHAAKQTGKQPAE